MTQASKKVIQLSHNKSNDHPLIDSDHDTSATTTSDNLGRAHSILNFIQGFFTNTDPIILSISANAGLFYALECAMRIIRYETSSKDSVPMNPIIDPVDSIHGTMDNIANLNSLIQQIGEIDDIDKSMCVGVHFVCHCIDHAISYHSEK